MTSKFEAKPNTGALFKNEKSKETDADYRGTINADGCEYWLNAWINVSQKTGQKYMKLSVKPKANGAPKEAAANTTKPEKPKSTAAEFNDEIPF